MKAKVMVCATTVPTSTGRPSKCDVAIGKEGVESISPEALGVVYTVVRAGEPSTYFVPWANVRYLEVDAPPPTKEPAKK